jgi:hypothetical protein
MKFCRACGARIVFAKTEKGQRMPLDELPDPRGRIVWNRLSGFLHYYTEREQLGPNEVRMTSHLATCPDADSRRARRHRRAQASAV